MSDRLKLAMARFLNEATKTAKIFGLRVDGIEVTQYRSIDHLNQAADRSPDNYCL